jgi:hypothetical protein
MQTIKTYLKVGAFYIACESLFSAPIWKHHLFRLALPAQPVDATLFYSVDPIVFFKET